MSNAESGFNLVGIEPKEKRPIYLQGSKKTLQDNLGAIDLVFLKNKILYFR